MIYNIPARIGRYEIVREIGRGGMGIVYEAHDSAFERRVAIKVLPSERLADDGARARFQREARLIASMEHEGIVPVYDYGEEEGRPYLVMRLMPGGSLAERLRDGAPSVGAAVALMEQLAPALDAAHQRLLIHRDLKPGNILFDSEGLPYLGDFGIAKLVSAGQSSFSQVMGTPAYMSPEQIQGEGKLDGRSDLYALGVIFWELVTGALPFEAETPMRMAMKHIQAPVPQLHALRPELPPALARVLERALAKEPQARYPTAAAFVQALRAALPDDLLPVVAPSARRTPSQPLSRRQAAPPRALPVALLLALVAVIGVGSVLALRGRATESPATAAPALSLAEGPATTTPHSTSTTVPRSARGGRGPSLPTQPVVVGFSTSTPANGQGVTRDATATREASTTAVAAPAAPAITRVVSLSVPADGATIGVQNPGFSVTVSNVQPGDTVALLLGTSTPLSRQDQSTWMTRNGERYSANLTSLRAGATYWWTALVLDERGAEVAYAEPRRFTVQGSGGAPIPTLRPPTATTRPQPSATLRPPTWTPAPPTATLRPPTWTPVPPTNVPPTNVPPTNVPPTNVPPTNVPPTNVPLPSNTPVPPATSTPVPPTSTARPSPTDVPLTVTPVPPTNTQVPPTNTPPVQVTPPTPWPTATASLP